MIIQYKYSVTVTFSRKILKNLTTDLNNNTSNEFLIFINLCNKLKCQKKMSR